MIDAATPTVEIAPAEPFSLVLRVATSSGHSAAEGGEFLGALFDSTFTTADHQALTAAHREIYSALESVADELAGDPLAGLFLDRRLSRTERLDADLARLRTRTAPIAPVPAAQDYARRIRESVAQDPALFVAHHYTRYLGDLSGGQMIQRRMTQVLPELTDATSFYEFSALGDLDDFKAGYRERLDAAPFTEGQRAAVIGEVQLAYQLNVRVFRELHALRATR